MDRWPYDASAWAFTRELIGLKLRERYPLPEELPPQLLTLVRKLDALEGNQLLGEGKERLQAQAPLRNNAAMKISPLLIALIAIVLAAGGTLAKMNNACKSSHHPWCSPMSTVRHHIQVGSK
jgi:hypothetical protein